MRLRQALGLLALAVVAGAGGLVAGTFLTHSGPPPWVVDGLSRYDAGKTLAQWWIDASAPTNSTDIAPLKPGATRPDLSFTDLSGTQRPLAEWTGQRVLLNFWATWCGPCREEMPQLDAARQRLAHNGVEVVGIALDDPDAVRAFLAAMPVTYPILLASPAGPDPSLQFGNTHGVLPYSVLLDRDGKILEERAGGLSADQLRAWLEPKP